MRPRCVPVSRNLLRPRAAVILGVWLVCVGTLLAAPLAHAEGEDPAALAKVTELNKKALDAYENLNFEEARNLLKQALEICDAAGLDKHPIKARTHIHMGAVLFGGFKQRDLAIKQFKKALEIQPDIKLTKSIATPEVQAAFAEAASGAAPATEGDGQAPAPAAPQATDTEGSSPPAPASPAEPTAPPPVAPEQPQIGQGLSFSPVTSAVRGKAIALTVTVDSSVTGVAKVVLAYRADGADDFRAHEMTQQGNSYAGEIPVSATNGRTVDYFLEAQGADDSVVVAAGSSDKPFTATLRVPEARRVKKAKSEDEDEDESEGPSFFVGVLLGSGIGYATGHGEVDTLNKVDPAGFAPASLGQLAIEAGYFLTPTLRLSLQTRNQLVSGANGYLDKSQMYCGSDHYCSPAKGAFAIFARLSWFLSTGTVRPYVSGAIGGGQIRHVVSFNHTLMNVCGQSGTESCKDTVLSGPVFVGPGGGVFIALLNHFGVVGEINTQLGFSKFTFNIDANVGVAATF